MHSLDSLIGVDWVNTLCEYLLLIVVLFNYKSLLQEEKDIRYGFFLLWLFLTIFSVFYSPRGGDSFTSLNSYQEFMLGANSEDMHFEPIYFAIMSLVQGGYVLWRFVIWGTAAAIFVGLLKQFDCRPSSAFFIWGYLGWQAFYYQRISLSVALLFLGVFILIQAWEDNDNRRVIKIMMALALIALSLLFHRSMPIYIAVSLLVFILPTNKWSIIGLLVLLPAVLPFIVNQTGLLLESSSSDYQLMGEIYLDSSSVRDYGIKGEIFNAFKWFPYALMMGYCVIDLVKNPLSYSKAERYFLLFSAVLYMLSFMFSGLVADSVGGKMKMQSILSMTMFLSLYFSSHKGTKQCNLYAKAALFTYLVIFIYNHFL